MSVPAFLHWVATLTIPQQAVVLVGVATLLYVLLRLPFMLLALRHRRSR